MLRRGPTDGTKRRTYRSGAPRLYREPRSSSDWAMAGSRGAPSPPRSRRGPCCAQSLGGPLVTNPALVDRRLYVVGSEGRVDRLDIESGKVGWSFDLATYSQTKPRLFSSPAVVPEHGEREGHYRIYLGAELQMPVNSAAMLFCLRD